MATLSYRLTTFLFFSLLLFPGGFSAQGRQLSHTPTWVVTIVCAVSIAVSVLFEKAFHRVATWLFKKNNNSHLNAFDNIKGEVMIVGLTSLLLSLGEDLILKMCLPKRFAISMLPCKPLPPDHNLEVAATSSSYCHEKGYEQLISTEGLHQLHTLFFSLAAFHTHYCFFTMMIGGRKIRGWKIWEQESSSSRDPPRFRLTRETSFVKRHTGFWTRNPFLFYVGCFIQQFIGSVSKTDYMTLRNGFIAAHLAPGEKFNFLKYIRRSLDDDYKLVVGISPLLWGSVLISLLLNREDWHTFFWGASFLPIAVILAVGTKLQAILTRMAVEISERHSVVEGIPLVPASDQHFWFSRPKLLLHLLHLSFFQTSFQIAYSLWDWRQGSCVHGLKHVILKLCLGLVALVLCSYITLPLYALVTQMGSHMKKDVFDEQIVVKKAEKPPTETLGDSARVSTSNPSASRAALFRFQTTGHMIDHADMGMSGVEAETSSPPPPEDEHAIVRILDEITEL